MSDVKSSKLTIGNRYSGGDALFDSSKAGSRVICERSDEPGREVIVTDERDNEFFSHHGRTVIGDHSREDQGWRQGEDMPASLAALSEPEDPGKVYTAAEIQGLYPDGYKPGAPSIHDRGLPSYRIPEARPKRICG